MRNLRVDTEELLFLKIHFLGDTLNDEQVDNPWVQDLLTFSRTQVPLG